MTAAACRTPYPKHWPDDVAQRVRLYREWMLRIAAVLPPNAYYLEGTCPTCKKKNVPRLINSEGTRLFLEGTGALPTAGVEKQLAQN